MIPERLRRRASASWKVTGRRSAGLSGRQVSYFDKKILLARLTSSLFVDNQYLASGGNDNRLYVWNQHSLSPVQSYSEHMAAVKAIAWSPHHHGLLVSGGGTADRCIRFWNTLTGQPMQCVDTGDDTFLGNFPGNFCQIAFIEFSLTI